MSQSLEKLAILIPTRNRPGILANTLQELRQAGFGGVALWVYDDCSTRPEAIQEVVQTWPNGHVIRGQSRVGQAQGRNVLMEACQKELGLFLDDDSYPKSVLGLERHLQAWPDSKRAIVTFQYLDIPTKRLSTAPEIEEGEVRSFQGGGSLFHIPTVLSLGGFRSFFVYGYEEPELAMRLRMLGYHIWYDPTLTVYHNHLETPEECRDYREYDYLYARNSILMSSLNMPLWFGLPHGLIRSVRRSIYRRRNFWPKLRGTVSGVGLSFSLWRQRTPCSARKVIAWLQYNRVCRT
jgi:GT2 family glycosyltransferase